MDQIDFAGHELTDEDFRRVSDVIYDHCGINLHDGKRALVRARLAKRLRLTSFRSFSAYIDHVLSGAGRKEFIAFVDSLSTNLTYFFRENAHFNHLAQAVLPDLLRRQGNRPRIRGWSAGCSTGEEPYSLAITLLENLPDTACADLRILATDVSTRVLEVARHGTYDPERIAPLTPQQKSRFLVPNRIDNLRVYQVAPALRNIVAFRYLNLMDSWPFSGPFDFIFCRNVMIYFDKTVQARLVNRFFDVLAPGGSLCIGHSESLTGIRHPFKYVRPATYMKPL